MSQVPEVLQNKIMWYFLSFLQWSQVLRQWCAESGFKSPPLWPAVHLGGSLHLPQRLGCVSSSLRVSLIVWTWTPHQGPSFSSDRVRDRGKLVLFIFHLCPWSCIPEYHTKILVKVSLMFLIMWATEQRLFSSYSVFAYDRVELQTTWFWLSSSCVSRVSSLHVSLIAWYWRSHEGSSYFTPVSRVWPLWCAGDSCGWSEVSGTTTSS